MKTNIKTILARFASYLQRTLQGKPSDLSEELDHKRKGSDISIVDTLTYSLSSLVCSMFRMPIKGESKRAEALNTIANRYVNTTLRKVVQTTYNTGDCITVPIVNQGQLENVVIDAESFSITDIFGSKIMGVEYVVDVAKIGRDEYVLLQDIRLAGGACEYILKVAKNGQIGAATLESVAKWSGYTEVWSVPNVDRLLIGRLKSQAVDPNHLNSVKGVPICFGGTKPIREIKELYAQLSNEFSASEKMVFAAKQLFRAKIGDGNQAGIALPTGKSRLIMPINGTEDKELIKDWSPEIRVEKYILAIEEQKKLLEQTVGVNGGIISQSSTVYENVDNVRKSQQKTIAFIDDTRNAVESYLEDLVYCWDILSNYYNLSPMGTYQVIYDWSNEYIETFDSKINQLVQGEAMGAMSAIDYRMWATDEDYETARESVERIAEAKKLDVANFDVAGMAAEG